MIFFKTILFLAIVSALPVAKMWSVGEFVGRKSPAYWASQLIRFSIAACLFLICASAAFVFFLDHRADWWGVPVSAAICGAGICGIIGINTYKGD